MKISDAANQNISIQKCSRCGGDHRKIRLWEFQRPPSHEGHQWGHWAKCPTTKDPILVQVLKTPPSIVE